MAASAPAVLTPQQDFVLRARWVLTGTEPPIRDGTVVCAGGRIVEVRPTRRPATMSTCEPVVVLPAFVNAHTHLEFSGLAAPLGAPNRPLPEWIRQVIAWRRHRDAGPDAETQRNAAIDRGMQELVAGGVGAVGEIATSSASVSVLGSLASPVRATVFREFIGLAGDRCGEWLQQARAFLDSPGAGKTWHPGLSPHAPYTVHQQLLAALVALSAERLVPLAMHLAETREELELLRDGTGPFRQMLEGVGAWVPHAIPTATRPLNYLQTLAEAHRALVVHGNYLEADELRFLAARRDQLAICYCPRTHAFFGHEPYPIRKLLDAGARVVLGTDSRASNPDLSLLAEVRYAAQRHPSVRPEEWLRMVTSDAAWALGQEDHAGKLEPGRPAQFLVVPLATDSAADPAAWLTTPA